MSKHKSLEVRTSCATPPPRARAPLRARRRAGAGAGAAAVRRRPPSPPPLSLPPRQAFKFAVYLGVPIALTWLVVNRPGNLEAAIRDRAYVKYPPEGPRPPTWEDLQARLADERRAR
jgi:protein PET100